ncbi:hypothetical protein MUN82_17180 [Hymenobacter aerilatus]|uniref:Tetratricopeptide repeat protein n=1 Tax=Hymenobacter aerilatus TaxID=2932251 RepID=A0A8T9SY08_9BACT|nr:hypothetical protein [Hymenobacter aerilatus]UOR04669.1 hypothetical protein MUN82_17180 [Hymenobacter aerilatus]
MPSSIDLRLYLDDLERFSDGQMTVAEQEAFEERLTYDADLQRAYQAYQQLTADLRWVAGHETLRLRLLNLDKTLDEREAALVRIKQDTHRRTRWGGIVAAGLVLAAAAVAYLLLRPAPTTTWARYYVPDPGLTDSTRLFARRPLLAEAMYQYRHQQYPAALRVLRRISTEHLGQDTLLYFNGIFLLRQGQAAQARPYLQRVSEQSESNLAGKALYHLGMATWQADQPIEARKLLTQVAADSLNPYQEVAQQILRAKVIGRE